MAAELIGIHFFHDCGRERHIKVIGWEGERFRITLLEDQQLINLSREFNELTHKLMLCGGGAPTE